MSLKPIHTYPHPKSLGSFCPKRTFFPALGLAYEPHGVGTRPAPTPAPTSDVGVHVGVGRPSTLCLSILHAPTLTQNKTNNTDNYFECLSYFLGIMHTTSAILTPPSGLARLPTAPDLSSEGRASARPRRVPDPRLIHSATEFPRANQSPLHSRQRLPWLMGASTRQQDIIKVLPHVPMSLQINDHRGLLSTAIDKELHSAHALRIKTTIRNVKRRPGSYTGTSHTYLFAKV